ncbi:MAG: PH domain-containing protein [Candidatus Curtissbacteria bacterium]|nr:PH domain-containing protein [Candidatus Curtissbacteria bacterium]
MPGIANKKLLGLNKNGKEEQIVVSHLTIRESITFLVLRLLALEIIAAIGIIIFHNFILSPTVKNAISPDLIIFNIPLFILLVLVKTFIMIFIIIQWLNEYYEITSKEIIHKKGLIFRREEKYKLEHLGSLRIEQDVIGRILNYGSLKLYNWALGKEVSLYLIHNPRKYHHVLQSLLPSADEEKKVFREHMLEKEKL